MSNDANAPLHEAPGESEPRYTVRLKVRFHDAKSYVEQYADNLSQGGIFVAGLIDVEPLDAVELELELPGLGRYTVQCRVAHVLDDEKAKKFGRQSGAGMAIISAPPTFRDALRRYLMVLGKRADSQLIVADPAARKVLDLAGYRVAALPAVEDLESLLLIHPEPTVVVVPTAEGGKAFEILVQYRLGRRLLLQDLDWPESELLDRVDRRLADRLGVELGTEPGDSDATSAESPEPK